MQTPMKSHDEETQVFIVRLWCERREIEDARPMLRGTVEHVASGERRSVRDLMDIVDYLLLHLEAMAVRTSDSVITQRVKPIPE